MIEQFLDYLRHERGLSRLTVDGYGQDLKSFESYLVGLEEDLSLIDADPDMIRGWMEQMMDAGNSASSVARRLSSLHAFYRYALRYGYIKSDPSRLIRAPKKAKPLPKFMRESEMDLLLDGEGLWTDSFADVRDRTIITTFYETGMRLSELIGLDDKAVDFGRSQLKVTGKRNKQRYIPFGNELAQTLRSYIAAREEMVDNADGALFVTTKGQRMNADQVRYVVKKWLARVSTAQKRSPHVLRHTFATAMLNHGAGIESVKLLLGHASIETTEIYTHTTFEQLKRAYEQALDRT